MDLMPRVTFCRPQIASVGWTEEEAQAAGHETKAGSFPFRALGKSVLLGHTAGHDVKVTIGVGAHCSQSMTQLRAKGDRMLMLP